jgi:hypothetical protein
MPFGSGPSVVHQNGCDYWRTWFLEECESSGLFGLTHRHLGLVTLSAPGIESYRIGTKLYLEDAPFFRGSRTHHRVCGPYEVYSLENLLPDAEPAHIINDKVIVFKQNHPERGPWLNDNSVTRTIDGIRIRFRKIADDYNYFPYRFAIRRSNNFKIRLAPHEETDCWLCR